MLCSSLMCSSKVTVLLSNLSRSRPTTQGKENVSCNQKRVTCFFFFPSNLTVQRCEISFTQKLKMQCIMLQVVSRNRNSKHFELSVTQKHWLWCKCYDFQITRRNKTPPNPKRVSTWFWRWVLQKGKKTAMRTFMYIFQIALLVPWWAWRWDF